MSRGLTTAAAASLATTASAAAQFMVFPPEGRAGILRKVNADTGETIRRISGLEAVRGLSGAPGAPYLIAGGYAETNRAAIAKLAQPEGVSEDEHAANHAKPEDERIRPTDTGKSVLSALEAATGIIAFAPLSPEPYHLTNAPGTGRLLVSSRTEPMAWIVDEATLTPAGEFPVDGEAHQMAAFR